MTFSEFMDYWDPAQIGGFDKAMAPYWEYVDHYFLFEDGLEHFFQEVGFPGVPLKHKGQHETPDYSALVADRELRRLVSERYVLDVELYNYWVERQQHFVH